MRAVAKLGPDNKPVEFVNKIETIDLRADGKYGDLLVHEPAQAEVRITRTGDMLEICIDDFVSSTIIKRLNMDQSLFRTQISDWRAQVNSVEIDTDYGGDVFTIMYSDIPPRKSDLVAGTYTLPAPQGPARVAVKITDMLGEEVIVTAEA